MEESARAVAHASPEPLSFREARLQSLGCLPESIPTALQLRILWTSGCGSGRHIPNPNRWLVFAVRIAAVPAFRCRKGEIFQMQVKGDCGGSGDNGPGLSA